MTSLPDRTRPRLKQPARRLAASALRLFSAAAWRSLHPQLREAYLEAPSPPLLPRIPVEAGDGWLSAVLRVPLRAGASGEPVLLVHTAGSSAHALNYGHDSLAGVLADAGFAVFLATHRGDLNTVCGHDEPPQLQHVATRDLPAALRAVREATGCPKVHVVGFGLGALFALDLGARCPDEVATITALAPPLRLAQARSEARRVAQIVQLLPRHWAMPLRALARVGAPMVGAPAASPGPRVRGALAYGSADVPLTFAATMMDWAASGRVEIVPNVDLAASLIDGRCPLRVVVGTEDAVLCPSSGHAVVESWGGVGSLTYAEGYGHVDLVLGNASKQEVHQPIADWLTLHRTACWGAVEDVA